MVGAEQVSGGGYDVAWKYAPDGHFSIWSTDSNGNFCHARRCAGGVSHRRVAEGAGDDIPSGSQRRRHDRRPGRATSDVTIESAGSTSLVLSGGNYHLNSISTGTGPVLKYLGNPVIAANWGTWSVIARRAGVGRWLRRGLEVARIRPRPLLVWSTDSNGNFLATLAAAPEVPGTDPSLKALEPTLHQDLNGDGAVGLAAAFDQRRHDRVGGIDQPGASGDNYHLFSFRTGTGPVLKYLVKPVIAANWGSWSVVGAERVERQL